VIGFLTAGADRGIGPERDLKYVLLAGTGGDIAARLREQGHNAVSVDEHPAGGEEQLNAGGYILQHPAVLQELMRLGCTRIVPFKPSRLTERVCDEHGFQLIAPDATLVRQLENKLGLTKLAEEAGVRIPRTERVVVDDTLPAKAGSFAGGDPVIFQPAVAYAGEGTVLIERAADVQRIVGEAPGSAGKLVEVVQGSPLTVTGVVLDAETVVAGAVCHQLTGIVGCTERDFASCGNDWTIPFDPGVEITVRTLARRIGLTMAERGFRGTFGIDVVAASVGEIQLIEVNPRFTASFSLQLQLQQLEDGPTLFDAHLAAFHALERNVRRDAIVERFSIANADPLDLAPADRAASSVLVQAQGDEPVVPSGELTCGRYRLSAEGALQRTGDGIRIDDIPVGSSDFIVFARSAARPVQPGAELARVHMRSSAASAPDCRQLLPHAAEVVAAVRSAALSTASVA
jgi:hypothetical protein